MFMHVDIEHWSYADLLPVLKDVQIVSKMLIFLLLSTVHV